MRPFSPSRRSIVPGAIRRRSMMPLALLVPLLIFAPFIAGRATTAAQDLTAVSVALDWYPNANHAGLFLAKERGYFAEEGLEVELYTPADPTVVLQTVGAGRDTFGISYQTDLLLARAQGVPVVSIAAVAQRPLMGVMSLRERGIARPRDLVGRTVGYPGIPSQEAFLATMLEADGARLDDVELVDVGYDLVPAVVSGRVDAVMGAYWTHETILAEREGFAVDLMRVEEWGIPAYYELVVAAGEGTIADDPETVRAFLRAVRRGYTDAAAEPGAALDALAAAEPSLDRGVESAGLASVAPVWTDGVPAFGTQTDERWGDYAGWMTARGLIPEDLDVGAAFASDLLPPPTATPVPRS